MKIDTFKSIISKEIGKIERIISNRFKQIHIIKIIHIVIHIVIN